MNTDQKKFGIRYSSFEFTAYLPLGTSSAHLHM